MATLRQHQPVRKHIGEYEFYIRPFDAYTSCYLTGEIASFFAPLFSGSGPLIGKVMNGDNDGESVKGMFDVDIADVAPEIANLLSGLASMNGKKVEKLMRTLLTDHDNISYEGSDGVVQRMAEDDVNFIFCCNVTDMFLLAAEVIKINFSGFFGKLSNRFGSLFGALTETKLGSTEHSILNGSATLS